MKSIIFLILISIMLCSGRLKEESGRRKIKSERVERRRAMEEINRSEERHHNSRKEKASKRDKNDALWEARMNAFKEILVRATLVSSALLKGFPAGHFLGMLFSVIKATKEEKGSLWEQVQKQVDAQIGLKLASYHESVVVGHFKDLDAAMDFLDKNSTAAYKEYVGRVMGKKHFMLPQEFESLGYSDKLTTMLPTWALYAIPGLLELVKRGACEECFVAEKLREMRTDAIAAGRSLLLKRYEALVPKSVERYSSVSFKDPFSDKEIQSSARADQRCEACDDVKEQTLASLKKEMIDVINDLFIPEFCFDCECPEKILMSEIAFDYRQICFGVTAGTENGGKCSLPCAKWEGSKKDWCLQKYYAQHVEPFADEIEDYLELWDYCTPTPIKVCEI